MSWPPNAGPRLLHSFVLPTELPVVMLVPTKQSMTPTYIRRPPRLLLLLPFVLAGCAVMFVAPYDAMVDKQVTELHERTRIFLAKMNASRGSHAQNVDFYQGAHASVAVIRSRAELYGAEKNKGTLANLKLLDSAFTDLEEAHRAGPLIGPAYANTMDVHFRSLLQIELHKKFSSGVAAPKS